MSRAFTLIELLVSISIVALITAMGLYSFTNYNVERQLRIDANLFAAKIGETRVMAYSGQKTEGTVPGAYVLAFDHTNSSGYFSYADYDGDCVFNGDDVMVQKTAFQGKFILSSANKYTALCFPVQTVDKICLTPQVCGSGLQKFYIKSVISGKVFYVVTNMASGAVSVGELQ